MEYYIGAIRASYGDIQHHGIKGQKWGTRRWQFKDGSLTPDGRIHYGIGERIQKQKADKQEQTKFKAEAVADFAKRYSQGRKTNSSDTRVEYSEIEKFAKQHNVKPENMIALLDSIKSMDTMSAKDKQKFEKSRFMLNTLQADINKTGLKIPAKVLWDELHKKDDTSLGLDSKINELKKITDDTRNKNSKINEEYIKLLKKNNAWSNIKDPSEFPEKDRKKYNELMQKLKDGRNDLAAKEYEIAELHEKQYANEIKNETDSKYIDPSYRKFQTKKAKADAEADYMERFWYGDGPEDGSPNAKKWNREVDHLSSKVQSLSMDGYEGIPKSKKLKEMFDYADTDDTYETYQNYKPKYKSSKEWKDLQSQREKIDKQLKLTEKQYAFYKNEDPSKNQELFKEWNKAEKLYTLKTIGIDKKEKQMDKAFNKKICEEVLRDMGYEVTPQNLYLIEGIIWHD